jgi:hypothetical protein
MGPAEDKAAAETEVYRWSSRGVEVTADGGFVTAIRIIWVESEGFRPFPGRCALNGNEIELSNRSSESFVTDLVGVPYWRDEDAEEIILFYEFNGIEWQVELNKQAYLTQWVIVSPPLMADAQQRRAYRVTRAWPPADLGRIRPRSAEALLKPRP